MSEAVKRTAASLYERDLFAWTQDQAAKLRARAAFDNRGDIDWENAAEEIEGVGASEKREIRSRLEVLLVHLLKWQFQPAQRKHGWSDTIVEQRRRIAMAIDDSPSLKPYPEAVLAAVYDLAMLSAARETGLDVEAFPRSCPFPLARALDPDFLPGAS